MSLLVARYVYVLPLGVVALALASHLLYFGFQHLKYGPLFCMACTNESIRFYYFLYKDESAIGACFSLHM